MSNPLLLIGTYTEPQGSRSKGLYVYQLDQASGELRYQTVIRDVPNVSFIAVHPISKLIYAVNETEQFHGKAGGGVSVLSRDASGNFEVVHRESSRGIHPCYISIEKTGRFALVANYTSGNIAMLPISMDGQLLSATDVVQHSGASIHPERQTGPHPHCILPDPANRFAISVDLGLDKLLVYRMDLENGKLQKHAEVEVEAGSGPRHLLFNSTGQRAYLLNELNSTLTVFHYDALLGAFHKLQTVSMLPEPYLAENYCGDLRLSRDEKFLYASNRGHDSIVCFQVDANSGELSYKSHVASGGNWPRIIALDPSGRFLVAAHQRSGNVVVYKIDPLTGDLSSTGYEAPVDLPVHVLFL